MVKINRNAFRDAGLELVLGTGRFVAPRRLAVKTNDGSLRIIEGEHAFINTGTTAAISRRVRVEGRRGDFPTCPC